MITCPKCGQNLMDWVVQCQFCGADTKAVARPVTAVKVKSGPVRPAWVWAAYYALAGYWILNGLYGVIQGLGIGGPKPGQITTFGVIGMVLGAVTALVGIGLIFHVEIARGIVNFLAGLRVIFGLIGIGFTLLTIAVLGPWGLIALILGIIDVATAAFMIYLIGETETRMPNV